MNRLCTLCDNALDGSVEHILLSAIGGRKTSRSLICGQHNNSLGSTIDRALAEQLAPTSSMLAIRTGRNAVAPRLRNLITTDGKKVDLEPGGRPVSRVGVSDTPAPDGKRRITITANSPEEAGRLIEQYLRKYGKTTADMEQTSLQRHIEPLSAPVEIQFAIGGEAALRAVAKVGLLLLASQTGTEAVRGVETTTVRNFILNGGNSFDCVRHDYVSSFPEPNQFAQLPFYAHRIGAFADALSGVAFATVELFGTYRFVVLLSETWTGPSVSIVYAVDPVTGTHDEVRSVKAPSMTGEQFRKGVSSVDQLRPRLERLLEAITHRQSLLAVSEMAAQAVEEILPPGRMNTPFTEEDVAKLSQELASRFTAQQFGEKYSKELDPAAAIGKPIARSKKDD